MFRTSLVLFVYIIAGIVYGQKLDTIFYDADWNEINTNINYSYYRVITKEKGDDLCTVRDYYSSHKLQMKGQFLNEEQTDYTGPFIWYYESGQKEREASYVANKLHGNRREWYENGQQESISTYKLGVNINETKNWYKSGQIQSHYIFDTSTGKDSMYSWWENGKRQTVGTLLGNLEQYIKYDQYWVESGDQIVKDGEGYMEYEQDGFVISGPIINGFRDGKWTKKDSNGALTGKLKFDRGNFVSGYLTENGHKDKFTEWEREPEFPGGGKGITKFIGKNLNDDCDDFVYNLVYVKFVIDRDGSVEGVKLVKGEVSDCQMKTIQKMLQSMPNWTPGMQAGYYVKVSFTLPLRFVERT